MGVDPLSMALFAVATVSAGASIYEGQQSAKYQQQAVQLQRQQADIVAARQQRDAVRQARMAYAQSQSAAERQGVGMGSSAQGGQSSIVSQLGDTMSFLDKYNTLSDQASVALGKSMQAQANEHTANQFENASVLAMGHSSQIEAGWSKIFGGGSNSGG